MAATLNRKDERQVRAFTHAAIKQALHDALFCPLTLGEKHDIRVKPGFETACWSFLPPHRIYVGTGIIARGRETMGNAHLSGYVKSHVRHELAHAHWTERNMRKVRQALKEIDAPFQLFNLFEDARIEDRYRREADFNFDWMVYEDLAYSLRPENMLFGLIQSENNLETVRRFINTVDIAAERVKYAEAIQKQIAGCKDPLQVIGLTQAVKDAEVGPLEPVEYERVRALALLESVYPFYARLISATDTAGCYPVLVDWIAEFGKSKSAPSMGCSGAEGEKSDLQLGGELAEDDEARAAFEANTEEVTVGKDGDEGKPNKGKAREPSDDTLVGRKGTVLTNCSTPIDSGRAQQLANKLKKFFEAESRTVPTTTPQRKVSARHFAIDKPFYRVKQLFGKAKKKLVIEVDCSGSMGGFHMDEGKILIAALSRLARQGYIEGHVLLSAGAPARWEHYELPMSDALIARIEGFAGAEGLEPTLKDHLPLLQSADYVFVYTDAQITDKPINKSAFHRYGVYTWGLYAGEPENYLEEMQKYFDKAIMRDNAEALVDAMLTQKK